ncbi:long-chain-fatty-acid--CoA ligase [Candidatus Regiella insecticola]|uniref:Long-chain-fatty-acid--CoA ligase n=2 Tax=Candidatus Regiella insecticola TaxID=138073 RepID=A0A6L2ZN54_9ENTR|nr:long-chain-fatty-acid--CoA ligase [Candidatus Regiella insecticola]
MEGKQIMDYQDSLFSDQQRKQLLLNPYLGVGNFLQFTAPMYPADCQHSLLTDLETVICEGEAIQSLSVHSLAILAGRWAKWYRDKGVKSAEPVAVYCDDGLNYIIHFVALTLIGAIPVLTNGKMPIEVAAAHFNNIAVRLVISDADRCRKLKKGLNAGIDVLNLARVPLGTEVLERAHYYVHSARSPVMITHSSGTTGLPKAVTLHHEQWFHGIRELLKKPHAKGLEKYLNALPTSHNSSIAFLIHCILSGSQIMLAAKRDGKSVADLIETYAPSTVVAFPQTYVELALNHADDRNFSSVNTWINSGDAAHEVHIKKLVKHDYHFRGSKKIAGSQFVDGLGSSEMGHISFHIIHTPYTSNYGRCVGFPQHWVHAKAFLNDGREVESGEVGMLGVKSPSITPGYWNNSSLTYKSRIGDYWLTGDMVSIDKDGRVFHLDRISDVIDTEAGRCYSLLTEEFILAGIAGLEECTVVGIPSSLNSVYSIPVALVVCSDKATTEKDLLQAINQHLSDKGLPCVAEVRKVTHHDIPKGITGKVLKRTLRQQWGSPVKLAAKTKSTA